MGMILRSNTKEVIMLTKQQIEKALTEIGITAEGHAKMYVPVDTGRLKNSITNGVIRQENKVYVGTNVEYATFVELGTSRQKPKPYIRPALGLHKTEYDNIIRKYMKK